MRSSLRTRSAVEARGLLRHERNGKRRDHRAGVVAHRHRDVGAGVDGQRGAHLVAELPAPRRAARRFRRACLALRRPPRCARRSARGRRGSDGRAAPRRSWFPASGNASRAPRSSASAAANRSAARPALLAFPHDQMAALVGVGGEVAHDRQRAFDQPVDGRMPVRQFEQFQRQPEAVDRACAGYSRASPAEAGCGRSRGWSGRARWRSRSGSAPRAWSAINSSMSSAFSAAGARYSLRPPSPSSNALTTSAIRRRSVPTAWQGWFRDRAG